MSDLSVKVGLRVRPLLGNEQSQRLTIKHCEEKSLKFKGQQFSYDYVFGPELSQSDLYEETAAPMLTSFIEGFNVTIMAYGQTGSGKTYTMGTSAVQQRAQDDSSDGLIPRFVEDLFSNLVESFDLVTAKEDPSHPKSSFSVKASFVEIYCEDVFDLIGQSSRNSLTVREDPGGKVFVHGLTEVVVNSASEAMALLSKGSRTRATAATNMNIVSSRSHAIFSLSLTQILRSNKKEGRKDTQKLFSKLTFVDLAGSERLILTGAEGMRMKEGIKINMGLLTLGKVINVLTSESAQGPKLPHVPYRESNLTRLLTDALGGNSRTLFLACVSPAESSKSETYSTLTYAARARNIKNAPVINVDKAQLELRRLRCAANVWMVKAVQAVFDPLPKIISGIFSSNVVDLNNEDVIAVMNELTVLEEQLNATLSTRPEVVSFVDAINAAIEKRIMQGMVGQHLSAIHITSHKTDGDINSQSPKALSGSAADPNSANNNNMLSIADGTGEKDSETAVALSKALKRLQELENALLKSDEDRKAPHQSESTARRSNNNTPPRHTEPDDMPGSPREDNNDDDSAPASVTLRSTGTLQKRGSINLEDYEESQEEALERELEESFIDEDNDDAVVALANAFQQAWELGGGVDNNNIIRQQSSDDAEEVVGVLSNRLSSRPILNRIRSPPGRHADLAMKQRAQEEPGGSQRGSLNLKNERQLEWVGTTGETDERLAGGSNPHGHNNDGNGLLHDEEEEADSPVHEQHRFSAPSRDAHDDVAIAAMLVSPTALHRNITFFPDDDDQRNDFDSKPTSSNSCAINAVNKHHLDGSQIPLTDEANEDNKKSTLDSAGNSETVLDKSGVQRRLSATYDEDDADGEMALRFAVERAQDLEEELLQLTEKLQEVCVERDDYLNAREAAEKQAVEKENVAEELRIALDRSRELEEVLLRKYAKLRSDCKERDERIATLEHKLQEKEEENSQQVARTQQLSSEDETIQQKQLHEAIEKAVEHALAQAALETTEKINLAVEEAKLAAKREAVQEAMVSSEIVHDTQDTNVDHIPIISNNNDGLILDDEAINNEDSNLDASPASGEEKESPEVNDSDQSLSSQPISETNTNKEDEAPVDDQQPPEPVHPYKKRSWWRRMSPSLGCGGGNGEVATAI